MINIFLDDNRQPIYIQNRLGVYYPDNWIICKTYTDFCVCVDQNINNIGIISFDHDLGDYDQDNVEKTGKNCLDYLISKVIETDTKLPNWYVHTNNGTGRENIIQTILNYLKLIENKDIRDWRYYYSGIINNKIIK